MNSGDLMVAINLTAFFGMIAFVVWIVTTSWQRRQQLKSMTDFNSRLLERIGSIHDFSEFLQTEGGSRFMESMTVDRGAVGPRDRILRATQTGVVLTSLGLGFLLLSRFPVFAALNAESSLLAQDDFRIVGMIVLSLGVGFLLSSAASFYLGRTLGVLDEKQPSSR